ncbi:mobilization protein, partial [Phocaeicola vulgatus]|nr:mobilization protein [Phocaeicola vulgatus]
MEQKKIEHITLNLIVFGTIAIIGILARQTALHYGWDEFSSFLILVVCSIIMGAIYLNLQMVFRQLLSPTIEKCFMRFECYRNKAVVVESSIVHHEV